MDVGDGLGFEESTQTRLDLGGAGTVDLWGGVCQDPGQRGGPEVLFDQFPIPDCDWLHNPGSSSSSAPTSPEVLLPPAGPGNPGLRSSSETDRHTSPSSSRPPLQVPLGLLRLPSLARAADPVSPDWRHGLAGQTLGHNLTPSPQHSIGLAATAGGGHLSGLTREVTINSRLKYK